MYFTCTVGNIYFVETDINNGLIKDRFFLFIEKMVDKVRDFVNQEKNKDVELNFIFDNTHYKFNVYVKDHYNTFRNILIDSFFALADTVFDHLGLLEDGYQYPRSFERSLSTLRD